jgi:hypothetical protein
MASNDPRFLVLIPLIEAQIASLAAPPLALSLQREGCHGAPSIPPFEPMGRRESGGKEE